MTLDSPKYALYPLLVKMNSMLVRHDSFSPLQAMCTSPLVAMVAEGDASRLCNHKQAVGSISRSVSMLLLLVTVSV